MRSANSCGVPASRKSTLDNWNPPDKKCTCASLKPGSTSAPRASTTRVPGPASARTSALVPTCVMRSPWTATASALGRAASSVRTRALTTTRSASNFCASGVFGVGADMRQARRKEAKIALINGTVPVSVEGGRARGVI